MRTFKVAKRLIKQIGGDKRSVGLLFIAPIFVLILLNVILNSSVSKPNIDVVSTPKAVVDSLEKDANITVVESEDAAKQNIEDQKSDAYIVFKNNKPSIVIEGSDPSMRGLVMGIVKKDLFGKSGQILGSSGPQEPDVVYMYGSKDMDAFKSMAPTFMGFFIFFFVFLMAGVSFLRERISGTLDRILATPLRRSEIVLGYFFGFGVFIALQTVVIQLFMVHGLGVAIEGSSWLVLLINILLASGSLALGTLLSTFARNEFQLFQFIPIVIVPQMMFSGIFDLREAPLWVKGLSNVFPLTYGARALKDVMIRGFGFSRIFDEAIVLLGYSVLFILLNIFALKKYRKI